MNNSKVTVKMKRKVLIVKTSHPCRGYLRQCCWFKVQHVVSLCPEDTCRHNAV